MVVQKSEYIGERYVVDKPYTIEVFCGNYDVPVKGADKENQWESEEVYRFLVVAVCPTVGEYEAGMPQASSGSGMRCVSSIPLRIPSIWPGR